MRLEQPFHESCGRHIITAIDTTITDWLRENVTHGGGAFDLVRSGCDDTMRLAMQARVDMRRNNEHIDDYRKAYAVAIGRFFRSDHNIGF